MQKLRKVTYQKLTCAGGMNKFAQSQQDIEDYAVPAVRMQSYDLTVHVNHLVVLTGCF